MSAVTAAAAPPKLARVGNYKLGKTLGIGSFCKVKLAVHEPTGQKVAIKILNRKKLKKQDMGAKVRTEIHILRLFAHPHIIRLYECIDTPTDIYLVQEYCSNGELFDYIVSRGKLEENEARSLFQQLISGVEYCHVHNVVHRDLKPENLLLISDSPPILKLADFGLSNRLKDGMFLKTSCLEISTQVAMAEIEPYENARGETIVPPRFLRVDQVSIGDRLVGTNGPVTITHLTPPETTDLMYEVRHADKTSYTVTRDHLVTLRWCAGPQALIQKPTSGDGMRGATMTWWTFRDYTLKECSLEERPCRRTDEKVTGAKRHASTRYAEPLVLDTDDEIRGALWREFEKLALDPAHDAQHALRTGDLIEVPIETLITQRVWDKMIAEGRATAAEVDLPLLDAEKALHTRHPCHASVVPDIAVTGRAAVGFEPEPTDRVPRRIVDVRKVQQPGLQFVRFTVDGDHRFALADGTVTHNCGSPNYAAPEVISGALYAGPEVDVWSAGVILYALLCGSLPFDDENIRALFRKIKGGIYTIPSHVSPGARELLSKMLIVDPLKRMTIPQVMAHPWYRTHLPLYLSLSAEQQIAQTQALDEAIIQKVIAQHGFTRDRLLKALSVGYELLTSRKYANQIEARKMAVIYNLLRDQKRRREQNVDECVDTTAGRPKDSANNVTEGVEDLTKMSPFAASTSKLLTQQTLQHQSDVRTAINNPTAFALPCLGGRWQLGMSSHADAQGIMNEVYAILRRFNFEWKVLSLYKIKARYPAGLLDASGKPVSSAEVCKIGIQLYKTSGRDHNVGMGGSSNASSSSTTPTQSPHLGPTNPLSPSQNLTTHPPVDAPTGAHVIDMQKLCGQMFHFLELSAHIIAALGPATILPPQTANG